MSKQKSNTVEATNVREFPAAEDGQVIVRPETGIFVGRLTEFRTRMEEQSETIREKIHRLDDTMQRTGSLLDAMDGFARQLEQDYREKAIKFGLAVPAREE